MGGVGVDQVGEPLPMSESRPENPQVQHELSSTLDMEEARVQAEGASAPTDASEVTVPPAAGPYEPQPLSARREQPAASISHPTVDQATNTEARSIDVGPPNPQPLTPLSAEEVHVFRSTEGKCFAIVRGRSYRIDSREFRALVRYELLPAPSTEDERVYLDRLLVRAHTCSPERTYLRACHAGDNIYVDLANGSGQAVAITPHGWEVVDTAPVRFIRSSGTRPLPVPARGGTYEDLQRFFRLSELAFRLFIANLTFRFWHDAPQPIMVFIGEHGSSKSSCAKLVQAICDPRAPDVRQPPATVRDLMVGAAHAWNLGFDNLSEIKDWLSNALCMLVTGGGYGGRTPHSDVEETTFDLRRAVVLTGIGGFMTRDDLRDRSLFYDLESLAEEEREDEATLRKRFEAALPGVLGSLFDLCSGALREYETTKPLRLRRLADFHRWALAVERVAGWPSGTIEQAYDDQRAASDADAMEDALAGLLRQLTQQGPWSGTPTELLAVLRSMPTFEAARWARKAQDLGAELRRQAPLLRRNNFAITWERSAARRSIRIEYLGGRSSSQPSQPSQPSQAEVRPSLKMPRPRMKSSDGRDGRDGILPTEEGGKPRSPQPAALTPRLERLLDGVRPPRFRPYVRVLYGKQLTAPEVLAALREIGHPSGLDQERISKELSLGTKEGLFERVAHGRYTYAHQSNRKG